MGIHMLAAALCCAALTQDAAPPKGKALDSLVAEYVALDEKDAEQRARRDAILAELERVPALSQKEAAAWRKTIAKLAAKGPELEKKNGAHYLWEEDGEERGFYIVTGSTRKPKGLFIGLHGGGAGSGDAWSAHGQWQNAAGDLDWIGIFPEVLEKTEHGWTDSGSEEFVIELIERALRTWKIDPDRVYLGGHSMGGYGTWTIGAHHADRFAALTPSAGAPTPILSGGQPAAVVADIVPGIVSNLRNVCMVIYQSDDDPRVPPDVNRKAVEMLARAKEAHGGYDYEYWEVEGRGHADPPGGMKALLAKVADHARNPLPDTVLWQPTLPWQRRMNWLWWDRPLGEAMVIAKLDAAKREIRVRAWVEPQGIYVLVGDEHLGFDKPLTVFFNDEEVFRGTPERTLAALVSTGASGDPRLTFEARIPLGKK